MRIAPMLLPKALECVDRYEKTTILDLGSPSPQTVSYFNRFRCQVYFADLVEQVAGDAFDEPELDIPEGVRFDICLFWDTLSYVDAPALRKVAARLATHIDTETRGHGFVAFSPASSFSCCRFRIEDTHQPARGAGLRSRFPRTHLEGHRGCDVAMGLRRNVADAGQPPGTPADEGTVLGKL